MDFANFYQHSSCFCGEQNFQKFLLTLLEVLPLTLFTFEKSKYLCFPRITPPWSCYISLFLYSWILFVTVLFRICALNFLRGKVGLWFPCLLTSVFPFVLTFWWFYKKNWEGFVYGWYNFFVQCLKIYLWGHLSLDVSLREDLKLQIQYP